MNSKFIKIINGDQGKFSRENDKAEIYKIATKTELRKIEKQQKLRLKLLQFAKTRQSPKTKRQAQALLQQGVVYI